MADRLIDLQVSEKRGHRRFQYDQSIVVQGRPPFTQEATNYTDKDLKFSEGIRNEIKP